MYNPQALGDPNCYSSSIPRTEVGDDDDEEGDGDVGHGGSSAETG
jgi:hypothetical protein